MPRKIGKKEKNRRIEVLAKGFSGNGSYPVTYYVIEEKLALCLAMSRYELRAKVFRENAQEIKRNR
jgi:hypothetical protein